MNGIIKELDRYRGTSVHDELSAILEYYHSIEHDFDDFCSSFGIRCPGVCGRCCERFIPDITRLEALALAFTLVDVQKRDISFLHGWSTEHDCCPLYNMDTHRCTVYGARPVICRVFCSSASRTKEGLSFRGCRLSTEPEGMVKSLDAAALSRSTVRVPVMGDYGEAVDQMQASSSRRLLDEAVLDEASRLYLVKSILESDQEPPRAG